MYKYKTAKNKNSQKDTAWRWFSKYIRLRDCLATTKTDEYCKCITCCRVVPNRDKQLHAGHMLPGRNNSILFDETVVFGQCKRCNEYGDGEKEKFKAVMVERNGIEWYEQKVRQKSDPCKITNYKLISDYYREKYNELKESI